MKKILYISLLLSSVFQVNLRALNQQEYDPLTGWTKDGTWNVFTASKFGPDGWDYDHEKCETDTDSQKSLSNDTGEKLEYDPLIRRTKNDNLYLDKNKIVVNSMSRCHKITLSNALMMMILEYCKRIID